MRLKSKTYEVRRRIVQHHKKDSFIVMHKLVVALK